MRLAFRPSLAVRAAVPVLMAGGFALAIAIVGYFGFEPVAHAFISIGWAGFLTIVACHCGIIALLGFCWWLEAPRTGRIHQFVWGRLIRDSGAELLPLSQLGGFVMGARAAVVLGLPAAVAIATTIVDVSLELIGQLAYVALGLVILRGHDADEKLIGWATASLAAASLATVGFLVFQRHGFAPIERAARRVARQWGKDIAVDQASVHREILATHHRAAWLAAATVLHFVAWLASGGEAWLALRFMGVPLSLPSVFAIESLLYAIRSVAFAVPNALGVQEVALVLLGSGFGLPPEAALALSLLKRARDLVIGVPALLLWQGLESGRLLRGRPPPGKRVGMDPSL